MLGDFAEVLRVGRGVDRRRQADVAHDVLPIRESRDGAEDEDGGQRGQWSDARMREQASGARIGVDDRCQLRVELVDPDVNPGEQLQAVIPPALGVRRQGQPTELGETPLRPQRRNPCCCAPTK